MIGSFSRMKMRAALLRAFAVLLATSAFAGCATTQGVFEKTLMGQAEFVDLTHPLNNQVTAGAEGVAFQWTPGRAPDNTGALTGRMSMLETAGTYIEAPARLVAGNVSVDRLPPSLLMGYGAVVDVRKAVNEAPGYQVTRSDIESWESDHGPIPSESILVIRTGWSERWATPARYANVSAEGKPLYPGISSDAVDFLMRERRVHAIGIDTPSPYAGSGNEPGQRAFLLSGKLHINNLTNLDQLPPSGTFIIAMPLKVQGSGAAPARVIAIMPQKKTEIEPGKKKMEQNTEMGGSRTGQPGKGDY